MHILTLLHTYASDIVASLAILSIVIEVAPIKLNPWSYLLKSIGNKINADVIKRLEIVEGQLKAQDSKIDNNEKDRIRYEILDFARSCRKNDPHTKEEFDHILEQYDKYEIILAKLEQPNGKVTQAMKFITQLYHTVQE